MKKFSVYGTAAVFVAIILVLSLWGLFSPDAEISSSERRKLKQAPEFTLTTLMSGEYFKAIDEYSADQFPLRDLFRGINTAVRTDILLQKDSKGLYREGDVIFKSDYPIKTRNIDNFINKTNDVYEKYIDGKAENYFVSVIPSKEYFDTSDHLNSDSKERAETFADSVIKAEYIDIFSGLSLESYYRTDTHWSQNMLIPVMDIFADKMNFSQKNGQYKESLMGDFSGVYLGQLALNIPTDNLIYLTSPAISTAVVENLQKPKVTQVYDKEAFFGTDGYDFFLSGGTPLTKITSPNSKTDKELVIFRDSFGSSIAPLFLDEYRTVTLVDLRYLSASLLPQYVDFTGKDVLVIYSSLMLNSNIQLK